MEVLTTSEKKNADPGREKIKEQYRCLTVNYQHSFLFCLNGQKINGYMLMISLSVSIDKKKERG